VTWDGDDYQRRFDRLSDSGHDVHGEATFVMRLNPGSVLDAGCGTGRIAIELARRGVDVVGVDIDASMLDVARQRAPELEWIQAELTEFDLGRVFDVVLMAGNVPLFTPPGTEAALVAGCARHVAPAGALVAGFQLDRGFSSAAYDDHCQAAGMELTARYATWDGEPFVEGGSYAVSVHRRRPPPS
jgi:2-polyprenyl-3-methyl-5-hydroxy-6-metoxy-1,4-benzoquinol methylase